MFWRLLRALLRLILRERTSNVSTGSYAPDPVFTGWDSNGDPLPGAKLFTYVAGSSTKATTWTNVGMTSANTNPIILDSAGRATIFLSPGSSYKFVLAPSTDTDPPVSPIWTRDNILGVSIGASDHDISGTAGEDLAALDVVYMSNGGGAKTAGRWYKAQATVGYATEGAYAIGMAVGIITSGSSGTIRISGRLSGATARFGALTPGTTYYISAAQAGGITSTAPGVGIARAVLMAETADIVVISSWVHRLDMNNPFHLAQGTTMADSLAYASVPGSSPINCDANISGIFSIIDSGAINNSTTVLTDMSTYVLPASSGLADRAFRFIFAGTFAANANNKSLKIKVNTTTLTLVNAVSLNGGTWRMTLTLICTGLAQQYAHAECDVVVAAGTATNYQAQAALTETFAATITVKSQSQSGTAGSDITQRMGFTEMLGGQV